MRTFTQAAHIDRDAPAVSFNGQAVTLLFCGYAKRSLVNFQPNWHLVPLIIIFSHILNVVFNSLFCLLLIYFMFPSCFVYFSLH